MERPAPDEAGTGEGLEAALRSIRETTFSHSGRATRSVHAKSHGIVTGTLTVADALPPAYAQGVFSAPGTYDVVMRFSTLPGDMLSDDVSTPRGVALKVIGVQGARLSGSEGDVTQDFIMVNAPAFAAPTPKKFLGSLKLLARTTDRAPGAKEVLSHLARAAEALLEAFGHKSPTVATLGGQPATHVLGDSFYTQTPFLHGVHYGKFALRPVSPGLTALTGAKVDVADQPDALRAAVIDHFSRDGGEWALQVQLATDAAAMPIEDASVVWPEDKSAYVTVGHVRVPPQNAWSEAMRRAVDDGLSFSPWHGLAAHRPLGGVNRARRDTYKASAAFRGAHTGCPMAEPRVVPG